MIYEREIPGFFEKSNLNMDYQRWDNQLEQDVADGKLDALAEEAIADFGAGRR